MPRREHKLMEMKQERPSAPCVINAYGKDGFRIGGQRYSGAVMVLPEQVCHWQVTSVAQLQLDDFDMLLGTDADIDLVLLGGGRRLIFPEPRLRKALEDHDIAIEAMDTGAAARTFNVLLAEERRVAAALFPLEKGA